MLQYNHLIRRVELNCPRFIPHGQLESVKNVVTHAMMKNGAVRGVFRVLTDGVQDCRPFSLESSVQTSFGLFSVYGLNLAKRPEDGLELQRETRYLAKVLCSQKRAIRKDHDIRRLGYGLAIAESLSALYSRVYSFYPVPLSPPAIMEALRSAIPYAVFDHGEPVSALLGSIRRYGELTVIEFTLSATAPSARGVGMTTALASCIVEEASGAYPSPLIVAETIAAPVMHSCHDLGMQVHGVLPGHYLMKIGRREYSNLFMWSL
ncbi:MAG: hypothetical protein U0R44_02475 [Candidatus Micrarchaeia archaeon]